MHDEERSPENAENEKTQDIRISLTAEDRHRLRVVYLEGFTDGQHSMLMTIAAIVFGVVFMMQLGKFFTRE